jgi:hypothetical protein
MRGVFGRDKRRRESLERSGSRVPAEILSVEFGRFVHERTVGVNTSVSAKRTVRLRIEPPGEVAYEAELELSAKDPMVPTAPGARFDVLVAADDPERLALPEDPVFTMPNGGEWRPPANAGIGRGGEAAALEQMEQIREAAERTRPPGDA